MNQRQIDSKRRGVGWIELRPNNVLWHSYHGVRHRSGDWIAKPTVWDRIGNDNQWHNGPRSMCFLVWRVTACYSQGVWIRKLQRHVEGFWSPGGNLAIVLLGMLKARSSSQRPMDPCFGDDLIGRNNVIQKKIDITMAPWPIYIIYTILYNFMHDCNAYMIM